MRLGSVTARHSSSGHQPNFAALNRGRHLYLAGQASRWALAHILVTELISNTSVRVDIEALTENARCENDRLSFSLEEVEGEDAGHENGGSLFVGGTQDMKMMGKNANRQNVGHAISSLRRPLLLSV